MNFAGWVAQLPRQRWPWLLLAATAFVLELCALYFQHVLKLDPCVKCIYERCAMLGLVFAGLIGAIAPTWLLTRWTALILWLATSLWGLWLSWGHMMLQMDPPLIPTCASSPEFPAWLPLNLWLPGIFESYGLCEEISWRFLGVTMVQWLVVVFALSSLIALLVTTCHLLIRRPVSRFR